MMKLTPSERQTLMGPLVVGCVLGAVVGAASWGFDSEYSHLDAWQMALDALAAFSAFLALVAGPLGILPVVVRRLRRDTKSRAFE